MHEDLHMGYKKLVQLHPTTNSDFNRVIRKAWAIEYIKYLKRGFTVWNIDETWISSEDFRRYAWGEAGKRLSVPGKKALIRISMVLAFNNHGNAYYAISD